MHLLSLLLLLAFGSVFPAAAAVPVADRNTPGAFQTVDSFEKARPVWAEGRECEKNLTLSFRAVVQAGKGRKADIRVAASTAYRLKVNGVFVGHGPCVAAHGFYRVDVYDLAPYLQPGRNVVSLEVAGYNEPSYYLLDQPSFLQAEIRLGRRVVAWTGRDFRAFDLGLRKAGVPRFSFQRPFMEVWRLTPESGRWETDPDFLSENEVSLAEQAAGKTILRRVPYPDYTLREAVRADAPAEETYSFGKDATGFLGLEVEADGPVRLEALFDELLSAEGRVDPARLSVEGRVVWELAAGRYVLESFEPYTLQYVQLKTEGGPLRVRKVYLRDYCNADVRTGRLEGGRPDLVRLFEAARETLRQSSLDIFMDCPSRERAGWLCDSFFAARVAFDLSGDTLLEKNFLENYLLPERFPDVPEGMLPMCYPADHRNHVYIPNWAMWFVLQLEEYLGRSGDRALVDEARDRVYALIRFLDGYCNADGLLEKLDSWVFVEWSAANEYVQDVNYPSNMLFAGMLSAAGRLYGDPSLTARAEAVRAAVRAMVCSWARAPSRRVWSRRARYTGSCSGS